MDMSEFENKFYAELALKNPNWNRNTIWFSYDTNGHIVSLHKKVNLTKQQSEEIALLSQKFHPDFRRE